MTRRSVPAFSWLAVVLPLLLLTGCVEPPSHSNIAQTIDQVSFGVPPQRTNINPGGPASTPPPRQPQLQPQVYGGTPSAPRPQAASAQQATRSAQGVQLNFERADIREVVKVILGDILRSPYTIDQNVSGEVTLSSSAPLAENDLLAVLESVLRANGASLVNTGQAYQIVPAEGAIGRSEVVPLGGEPPRVRPGYGITIVPLHSITATAAAQFIQPLVSAPEDIRIDPARNAVLFSGTSAERQNVVETLAELDVGWLADKAVGLFPLRLGTPEGIVPELQSIFAPFDPSSGDVSLIRFMPIARLNAILAVGTDREQVTEAGRWVARLDRGESIGPQFYVYYLQHGVAEDVAKLLNEAFGDGGGSSSPQGLGLAAATPSLSGAPPVEEGGDEAPPVSPTLPTPGATESGSGGSGTKIVANKTNNSLLIRATPQAYETIEATLRRIDTAPYQVLIEATIAEVLLNDQLRYGVQYFIEGNNFGFGFNSGTSGLEPQPTVPGFNFLFTGGSANITIDALARVTDVKVLSSPSVVVQDNSEAELTVGNEVPIITRQATSVEDVTAPTLNTVEYRDTGVILQVRPRININGVVSLEIAQEVSRVNDEVTPADSLTPTITQRKITSRVNVQTGQTVVLGGLIEESETRGRDRIPILGEIPVVGGLFGTTNNVARRTELIVFITPRVIRNGEDAREVSEEIRARLKALRPADAPVAPPMPNVAPFSPDPSYAPRGTYPTTPATPPPGYPPALAPAAPTRLAPAAARPAAYSPAPAYAPPPAVAPAPMPAPIPATATPSPEAPPAYPGAVPPMPVAPAPVAPAPAAPAPQQLAPPPVADEGPRRPAPPPPMPAPPTLAATMDPIPDLPARSGGMAPIPDPAPEPAPAPATHDVAPALPSVADHAAQPPQPPSYNSLAWEAGSHESRLAGSDATAYAPIPRVRPDEWPGAAPPPRHGRTLLAGG